MDSIHNKSNFKSHDHVLNAIRYLKVQSQAISIDLANGDVFVIIFKG